jgi:hypothetical protein
MPKFCHVSSFSEMRFDVCKMGLLYEFHVNFFPLRGMYQNFIFKEI